MKIIIKILIGIVAIQSYSQHIEIDYYPTQKEGVSDERFEKGRKTLEGAYQQLKEDHIVGLADYWNIATGLNYMGEDPERIYNLLVLAKNTDPNDFCVLIDVSTSVKNRGVKNHPFYKSIGDKFLNLIEDCSNFEIKPVSLDDLVAKKQTLDLSGLNESLIDRIIILMEKDQRYRSGSSQYFKDNLEAVKKLDAEVEAEVIKIFEEYGYPGKDIVGEHYQSYLCLLLEHSAKLTTQDKYFPLVAEAFKNNQLQKGPFKMLIDRMHFFRSGIQIFGSHAGVPYADDIVIKEIKKTYNL